MISFQIQFFRQYLEAKNEPCTEETLESLHKEANIGALASHLMWGLWSIVQNDKSNISFGYFVSKPPWNQFLSFETTFIYSHSKIHFLEELRFKTILTELK